MQNELIHFSHEDLIQYYAIAVEQESPTVRFVILEEPLIEVTLRQLMDHILGNHLLREYFCEPEQIFDVLIRALKGLAFIEQQNQKHGDITPCSISISGRLLDYLHIKDLVDIAQGTQTSIYDAPTTNNSNSDVWSIGICFFEMMVCIEQGQEGQQLLQKLNLPSLSSEARKKVVKSSVSCRGASFLIQVMLADDRPTAQQLLSEPFVVTLRQIIDEQTPPSNSNTLALLTALKFQNKNKGLIAFLSLLQKDQRHEVQITQQLNLTDFIHILELLTICLSQTQDFDQLCLFAIQWLVDYNITQEDFRLAGGVPLLILMCRRGGQVFATYVTKLLNKFSNPTLQMIAEECCSTLTPVSQTKPNDLTTLRKCHILGHCTNDERSGVQLQEYDCIYFCIECSLTICHPCFLKYHNQHKFTSLFQREIFCCQQILRPDDGTQVENDFKVIQECLEGNQIQFKVEFETFTLQQQENGQFTVPEADIKSPSQSLEVHQLKILTKSQANSCSFYVEIKLICGGYYDQVVLGVTAKHKGGPQNHQFAGYQLGSIGWFGDDGSIYKNGQLVKQIHQFSTGDVVGVGLTASNLVYFTRSKRLMFVENLKEFSDCELTPTVSLRGCLTTVKVLQNQVNPLVGVLLGENIKSAAIVKLCQSNSKDSKEAMQFRSVNSSSGLDKYKSAALKRPSTGFKYEFQKPKRISAQKKEISRLVTKKDVQKEIPAAMIKRHLSQTIVTKRQNTTMSQQIIILNNTLTLQKVVSPTLRSAKVVAQLPKPKQKQKKPSKARDTIYVASRQQIRSPLSNMKPPNLQTRSPPTTYLKKFDQKLTKVLQTNYETQVGKITIQNQKVSNKLINQRQNSLEMLLRCKPLIQTKQPSFLLNAIQVQRIIDKPNQKQRALRTREVKQTTMINLSRLSSFNSNPGGSVTKEAPDLNEDSNMRQVPQNFVRLSRIKHYSTHDDKFTQNESLKSINSPRLQTDFFSSKMANPPQINNKATNGTAADSKCSLF